MEQARTHRDERIAVELAIIDVRQFIRARLARAGGETTISLYELATTLGGNAEYLETAMVVLQNRVRGMAGVTIEREPGEPVRWTVRRDGG